VPPPPAVACLPLRTEAQRRLAPRIDAFLLPLLLPGRGRLGGATPSATAGSVALPLARAPHRLYPATASSAAPLPLPEPRALPSSSLVQLRLATTEHPSRAALPAVVFFVCL